MGAKQVCQKIVRGMWTGKKVTERMLRKIGGLNREQREYLAGIINSDKFVTKQEAHKFIHKFDFKANQRFVVGLFQAYTRLPKKATSWLQGSKDVVQGYRLRNVHADVKRYSRRGVGIAVLIEDLIKAEPQKSPIKIPANLIKFLMSMDESLVRDKKRIAHAIMGAVRTARSKYSAKERNKLRLIVQKFDIASTPRFDKIARAY